MAATYRIVVSTINCYNSVIIDRRYWHTIHYCNGPCQAFRHGIECTVAHHSTCSEPLGASVPNASNPSVLEIQEIGHKLPAVEGSITASGITRISRVKKGSSLQSSTSLKDITGEAINLASGKIKEFSFEKVKYSSSHVTFRKGRKVRPESFNRRSADFDLIYGHFGNDENCPPFNLMHKSMAEEKGLARRSSLEQNISSVATFYLQSFSEENILAKLLEKHKADNSASGEDIRMCLDILLKCSEDLKKCTDIIKQCIKKKTMGGSNDDSSNNPEIIYRNVMSRLSTYLKKLPFELEHGQSGRTDHSELAELVNSLHGLQQTPFSPIFGIDQPPRYEDVVQSPPSPANLPPSAETQDVPSDINNSTKLFQANVSSGFPSNGPAPKVSLQQKNSCAGNNLHSLPQMLTLNRSDSCSSTDSLLSRSSDGLSKESMEALFIEEETDVEKVLDQELKGEGKFSIGFAEVNHKPGRPDSAAALKKDPVKKGTPVNTLSDSNVLPTSNRPYLTAKSSEAQQRLFKEPAKDNEQEDIEKLLLDLECFSQKLENVLREPCEEGGNIKPKDKGQQVGQPQPLTLNSGSKVHSLESSPPLATSLSNNIEEKRHGNNVYEEEDGALLLRILESIESFAQELVECGTGKGTLSREKEVMKILQETLANTSQSNQSVPKTHTAIAVKDSGPTLLIQQTPEVIKVQSKQEKKPGTPPPSPVNSTPITRPLSPPPVNKAVVTAPVSINIPRFYFPKGLPNSSTNHEETIAKIEAAFAEFDDEKADIYEMGKIAKACGCPLYWKAPMFNAAGGERTGFVSVHAFIAMWRKSLYTCHDDASKFVYLLTKPGCNYLEQEDFIPLLQDLVDTHPGLTFLKDAPEFHSRYITTVIQRIFYTVNRSWSGKITLTELRKSNFLQTLALLEEEDDINQITDYFSYEHFYVIYCKFWELDTDHDLYIDQKDLARYNDHASSNRIIERIFSGAVTSSISKDVEKNPSVLYPFSVLHSPSERDGADSFSIEYWFRAMDLDGDGMLSMYELEFFYEEQCERMEAMGIEPLPFHDLLCQMLDLVKPEYDGKITLRDLKRCRMAHIFYDTFFNLEKYLDHEQRDPFAVQKDVDNEGPEPSDWDKYAAEEYEILVAEESANEQLQEGSFEDDYESDELVPPPELGNKMDKLVISDL
uniref:Protein phosphatase 2 regulatory subunit B''alpha n=1 Tax=Latimeria chalumnae TaxID=7897 RepID=H3AW25_LATCH